MERDAEPLAEHSLLTQNEQRAYYRPPIIHPSDHNDSFDTQEVGMPEPFEIYTDAFTITVSAWGSNMSFQLREAHPEATSIKQPERLGTVRMSTEHLKAMIFLMRKQVLLYEQGQGVRHDLPTQVLSQMQIPREDWDAFWN